jgi:hypothetical protein
VFDPLNYQENLLSAGRALEQISVQDENNADAALPHRSQRGRLILKTTERLIASIIEASRRL